MYTLYLHTIYTFIHTHYIYTYIYVLYLYTLYIHTISSIHLYIHAAMVLSYNAHMLDLALSHWDGEQGEVRDIVDIEDIGDRWGMRDTEDMRSIGGKEEGEACLRRIHLEFYRLAYPAESGQEKYDGR